MAKVPHSSDNKCEDRVVRVRGDLECMPPSYPKQLGWRFSLDASVSIGHGLGIKS
jgi:hypothetical protein